MIYYAVIDTNVLVSAMLKYYSVPGEVLRMVFNGKIIPLLNEQVVKEYREVLNRPKFQLTGEIVDTIVGEIERLGICINAGELDIEMPDLKDKVFYEIVMEERKIESAYLVTGNLKHFPEKPFIVTPRQIIDIIAQGTEGAGI